MKTAQGYYLNLFSETSQDNWGLTESVDIFIIFPEYMSKEECAFDKVEDIVKTEIEKFTSSTRYVPNSGTAMTFVDHKITEILLAALIDYDAQILVKLI